MDKGNTPTKYFKNRELIRLYGVSDKTIRNWIEKASQDKVNLELVSIGKRLYIADTFRNSSLLHQLTQKGRKYRNRKTHRVVKPTKAFYDLYSEEQIIDIANNLEKYRETPVHYRYLGKGASYWDAYLKKIYATPSSYLTGTIELLDLDSSYIERQTRQYSTVNIIDIGVGNGLAAKGIVEYFLNNGKLRKYVGVDISESLLDKTAHNLRGWFSQSFTIEKHVRDISHERFLDALLRTREDENSVNVVLFLGGTITNFREPDQPLKVIRDSLSKKDILLTTLRIDSLESRNFFDYDVPGDRSLLAFHDRYTLDLLSIDRSCYDIEQGYEENLRSRYIRVKLRVDLSIDFMVGGVKKRVELRKGEHILLIRMWHFTEREAVSLYEKCGFTTTRSAKSDDEEFLLIAARVT